MAMFNASGRMSAESLKKGFRDHVTWYGNYEFQIFYNQQDKFYVVDFVDPEVGLVFINAANGQRIPSRVTFSTLEEAHTWISKASSRATINQVYIHIIAHYEEKAANTRKRGR